MRMPCRFRFLEPTFFAGLLDDPLLWVYIRPLGRSLLFDCGQMTHLAKRVMKAIDAVFITHAHMDHFMGIATLVRHLHASPRTIRIFGPPGIATKMAGIMAGFDWNLTEPYWCTFLVHEIHPGRTVSFRLPGAQGFPALAAGEEPLSGRVIYTNPFLSVAAELADHKLPVLFFLVRERSDFRVDGARLAASGLVSGPWLLELKRRFCRDELANGPLPVLRKEGETVREGMVDDAAALYNAIRREHPPASIGYLTDIGFTPGNRALAVDMLRGVTLLVCECSFLAGEEEKARNSWHLCTADLNRLVEEIRPACLLPIHMSKSYLGKSGGLYRELVVPPGTILLRLPEHIAPRPLIPAEARARLSIHPDKGN